MPTIDRNRIARFPVIVRKDWRKLLEDDMRRKFLPSVIKPGLRIERIVVARAHGIIPIPTAQLPSRRMIGEENARSSRGRSFRLLKHRELIGVRGAIFVYTGFNVPPGKIASESPGKGPCAESAHRRTLPETVVNVARIQGWFFRAGIVQRLPDGALPRRFGNLFAAPCG